MNGVGPRRRQDDILLSSRDTVRDVPQGPNLHQGMSRTERTDQCSYNRVFALMFHQP